MQHSNGNDISEKRSGEMKPAILVLTNVLLLALAIVSTIIYTVCFRREQKNVKIDAFVSAVESMKSVSAN